MKSLYISLAAVLALAQGKSIQAEDELVKVQVYYETLCPDSIAFITKQLYPTYAVLSEHIDLELVPWGRATEEDVNGNKTFTCQHGAAECYGNIAHACAINLTSVEQSTKFVFCSERSDAPTDDVILKECAETSEIAWDDLQNCISNGQGADLLSENGKKTDLVNPSFIPTIILNGTFNQEIQDESLEYFKVLICELVGYPQQCQC